MAEIAVTSLSAIYNGTENDDVFVFSDLFGLSLFMGTINGGGGKDTIRLINSTATDASDFQTEVVFSLAKLTGIEALDFSLANGGIIASFWYSQISNGLSVTGGSGQDIVSIYSTGSATVPPLSFSNWTNTNDLATSDLVLLSPSISESIVFARNGLPSMQVLATPPFGRVTLVGSDGADAFLLTGNDVIALGGKGDDLFRLIDPSQGPYFQDMSISGGEGYDTLLVDGTYVLDRFSVSGVEALRFVPNEEDVPPHLTIFNLSTIDGLQMRLEGAGALTYNLSVDRPVFDGSALTFADDADIALSINGTAKSDLITGTVRADTIDGGDKADILKGLAGDDHLLGGQGNDTLQGGEGDDVLDGGLGTDILAGGDGIDTASYQSLIPADLVTGVTVDLRILAGAQDTGLGGVDTLASIENLLGSEYNDTLIGNGVANILDGGAGDDSLIGGRGADILTGDLGADRFIFQSLADSPTGLLARDTITDFLASEGDRIDLSAIDANINVAGDQAFFLGGAAFTRHAGEIIQVQSGDDLRLLADTNGDGVADMAIYLQHVTSLDAAAFIL